MTRLAQLVFAVLLCGTVAAFFVAQRLKSQTPPVRALSATTDTLFSPNGDGVRDTARISFRLKLESDDVTLDVIDEQGEVVRRLVDDRFMRAGPAQTFVWNGRDDAGRVAPDGIYRPRVKLRRQGRTIVLPVDIALDRTPPRPAVTVIGFGERRGPATVRAGRVTPVSFRFSGPAVGAPRFEVYRTDLPRPQIVASFPGREGVRTGRWDGRVRGEAAVPGTYLIVARVRDAAGNLGSVPAGIAPGRPLRGPLPGRGGITVRGVAVQAPLEPYVGGDLARLEVDAQGRPYDWSMRRVGSNIVVASGSGSGPRLRVRIPEGRSGLYLVRVKSGRRTVGAAPIVVQSPRRARVLVVLPAISWQGRNAVDGDGDGVPETLERGLAVSASRGFAGTGIPEGLSRNEGAVLDYLDRLGVRFDLTTDLALVRGNGPPLVDRPGVLLAGALRWTPPTLESSLRGYVERGGTLVSLGTDALRRNVRVQGDRLVAPSPPADTDAFGARLDPVQVDRRLRLLAFPEDPLGLWRGSDGQLTGFDRYEGTADVLSGARLVAGAGEREDRPVVAVLRAGRGHVIRTGLPDFSAQLGDSVEGSALMRRMWTILERGPQR